MHFLITGGAGFIGSHLTEQLLSAESAINFLVASSLLKNDNYLKQRYPLSA
ncbi:MAG: GDP-mannose 4,6-dehydratase [Nostoc sp. ChiQUE02]|uniref:GDP-mannose 4,6-dehydratase n=1 Tax=Nostoc sp. ChiQUE02 TaxID=3075377 RepID=UPI002AD2363F|nr:GDP-mannose 4,6-dehydratase [Nostoc sp. ChiQUE02]MDZ8233004.1 GDP-mannose 4,6-dehydratase [Nostoc sp. ChiQUE02]